MEILRAGANVTHAGRCVARGRVQAGVARGASSRPPGASIRADARRINEHVACLGAKRIRAGHRVGDYFRPGFDGSMRVTPPIAGGSLAGNVLSSASSM
nr:hypothetical protein [Burkholderia ubonensis]